MSENTDMAVVKDWFWQLLETSHHRVQALCEKLEALSREELVEFQFQYNYASDDVNPFQKPELEKYTTVKYISQFTEDDCKEFANWVVSQGREFFDRVRLTPPKIHKYMYAYYLSVYRKPEFDAQFAELRWDEKIEREEYEGLNSPEYIAGAIYTRKYDPDDTDLMDDEIEKRWETVFGENKT